MNYFNSLIGSREEIISRENAEVRIRTVRHSWLLQITT